MSLLNQANDGLFNVLIVLIRVLVRFGPKGRDELIISCGGDAEPIDQKHLVQTLNRWVELGLLNDEQGHITVAEPYRALLGNNTETAETCLPAVCRTVVLLPANNLRFWESEESKSADFSRGAAWMLAQDVYKLEAKTDRLENLENSQLATGSQQRIVQNDTRWNGLRAWMLYLGFARDGTKWFIDPTDAIRDVLPEIFKSRDELLAVDFVSQLASVLPVLDGGNYRTQVEAALKDNALPRGRVGLLSTSLSRAMQRLDRGGAIRLTHKADALGSVSLGGSNERTWKDVSHVQYASRGQTL